MKITDYFSSIVLFRTQLMDLLLPASPIPSTIAVLLCFVLHSQPLVYRVVLETLQDRVFDGVGYLHYSSPPGTKYLQL